MAVQMELVGVRVDVPSNNPIMVLREITGDGRLLAIMIGGPEAQAIAFALDGIETPRPLTHDLIASIIGELGARLDRVVISAMRDDIYYADLVLEIAGRTKLVSARPSDAIAVAVRMGTPVYTEEAVLADAGYLDVAIDDDEEDEEDVVEEFKEFIEHVNPEDFAS